MGSASATLAGVKLEATAPNAWALQEGTDPYQAIFEIHTDRVKQLLAASKGKEVEFALTRSTGTTFTCGALTVIGAWPTSVPWTWGVLVSDRRWLWNRVPVCREYNLRRRTGNTVRVGANNDAKGVTIPEVQYAPWTLNGGKPWDAIEVLKDVLKKVAGKFDLSRANTSKILPIENLVLDDAGDAAVARVLAFLPGNGIYLDEQGVAVVYDKLNLNATLKLLAGRKGVVGGSLLQEVTFERTRPASVVCLFERETEIRVDYLETTAGALTGLVMDPREQRQCQNVLPCPDPTLAIPAGPWGPARIVAQGTWITFDEFFAAVNNASAVIASLIVAGYTAAQAAAAASQTQAPTFFGDPLPPFSADVVRQLWTPIGGLLALVYAGANVAPDPVWTRRIGTCLAHYRQTFRLPPRWRDKIRSMRANRVRIVDTVTGTRAPAEVWVDHCVRPTMKRLASQPGLGQLFGWNVFADGVPSSTQPSATADLSKINLATIPSTRNATLSIVDDEQGIWRIDFRRAPDLGDADVLPSAVEGIPNADPSETILTWDYAKLAARHRLAAIFSVAQAAPNDERRFHAVTVTPEQAGQALGKPVGACEGPTWYLRIRLPAARFGWDDAGGFPQKFDAAYGAGESGLESVAQAGGGSGRQAHGDAAANAGQGDVRLADLGTPTNDDEVQAVAKAAAAALYASLQDRLQGGLTVPLDPTLRPTGSLGGVLHTLMPEGNAITSVSLPPALAPVDLWSLVPDSIRRKIKNQVQPPT